MKRPTKRTVMILVTAAIGAVAAISPQARDLILEVLNKLMSSPELAQ